MKAHWTNAFYGVLDYLAYPLGLLLLAPVIVRGLGMERYGIWAVVNAMLNTGAIVASGFGDANIRLVAIARGKRQRDALINTVRSALGIHLLLGMMVAVIGWLISPALTQSALKNHAALRSDCLWSFRIAAVLILIRALETVCVSTQRAFARYGAAIQVSVVARLLSLLAAGMIPLYSHYVWVIMAATLTASILSLWIQFGQLRRLLGVSSLPPMIHLEKSREILRFGGFTWIQASSTLLFGQVDRIIAATMFGATAVASYSLCVQLAQPIYGVSAAGLHFIFPLLASGSCMSATLSMRRSILKAFAANAAFAAVALSALLFSGNAILGAWGGASLASAGAPLLPAIAWSAALSSLSVTGCYSLLALGKPRIVTGLNLLGGFAMFAAIPILTRHYELAGIAYARLLFGPATLLVYLPLFFSLTNRTQRVGGTNAGSICEES
jgi:O-antigen/teichoic acid export membrane protein